MRLAMSSPEIEVHVGPVARLVLNRPEQRNAMTVGMGEALVRAVEALNASSEVRVVLVEGAGRAFCAGGDFDLLEANAQSTPEQNRRQMLAFYALYLSVLKLRAPSVAVLHGAAIGAGLCLAMACDLRVAAAEAKLGANFVRVGLHPGMACTLLLPDLVGAARARDLILSGRIIDGVEAERVGLVQHVVPRAGLADRVSELAAELTRGAPIAVAQAKETLAAPLVARLEATLAREASAQAVSFSTEDLREAVAAFREKREPAFANR